MCAIELRRPDGSVEYFTTGEVLRISGKDPNRHRAAVSTNEGFTWYDDTAKDHFERGESVLLEDSGIILSTIHPVDATHLKAALQARRWKKE